MLKARIAYSVPLAALLILPDVIFLHGGVLTIVGLIVGYIGWKRGPEFGEMLEKEGLHPRAFLQNRVIVTEIKPKHGKQAIDEPLSEDDDAPYEEELLLPAPSNERSSGELQALESMGYLTPGARFVLGVREDGTIIEMKGLSSLGIGGRQGMGKTVSMLSLVTQSIPIYNGNIKFVVVDPHMNIDPEEEEADNSLAVKLAALEPFLMKLPGYENPVSGGKKLVAWLRWLEHEYKERLGTDEKPGKKADCYLVIVIDEFGSLLNDAQVGPLLVNLLVQINEQARKVKMFALVASPTWKASRMQGTDLRNSIATFVLHNMPANIAQQIVDPDVAKRTPKLTTGEAITYSKGEMDQGSVPHAKPVDLAYYVEQYAHKSVQLLPEPKRAVPASSPTVPGKQGGVISSEVPTYEEGLLVHRYYSMLREVSDDSDDVILTKIAVLVYGNEKSKGKVMRVMDLHAKHQV